MAVIWQASPKGHYSDNVIAISDTEIFYLSNGSYNDKTFPVTHIGVSAAGNSAITTIQFSDGSSFTVSPFTNSLIDVGGRESCVVENDGDTTIKITLMDESHASAYGSQYTQPPWQGAASLNELLYHFTEDPAKNYGFDIAAVAAPLPAETITTTGGKFTDGGYITGNGTKTAGIGFAFTDPLLGSSGFPFTIDMWVRPQGVQATASIMFISTVDDSLIGNVTTLLAYNSATGRWTVIGAAPSVNPFGLVNGVWSHLAIVRNPGSATTKFFMNGTLIASANVPFTDSNLLYLQTRTGGGVNDGGFNGDIGEFRYTNRAMWLSNFTPPIAPYK